MTMMMMMMWWWWWCVPRLTINEAGQVDYAGVINLLNWRQHPVTAPPVTNRGPLGPPGSSTGLPRPSGSVLKGTDTSSTLPVTNSGPIGPPGSSTGPPGPSGSVLKGSDTSSAPPVTNRGPVGPPGSSGPGGGPVWKGNEETSSSELVQIVRADALMQDLSSA